MLKAIIILLLATGLQLVHCDDNFYIVRSGLGGSFNCPQPGFDSQHCLTLQQYADNQTSFQRQTENITLQLEPGFHVMTSTLVLRGNQQNTFTVRTVNGQKANILCIGVSTVPVDVGGFGVTQFHSVSVQDLNFIECRNQIGTTNDARIQNVQFQSSFFSSDLLSIVRVDNAVLTQTQFLPSICGICTGDTPLLSIVESSVAVQFSSFSSNPSERRVSGIIADDADIRIENTVFTNFAAKAIVTRNGGNRILSITESMFLNNTAVSPGQPGGAISSTSLENTIDSCQFENNFVPSDGGALFFTGFNSSVTISRSSFHNNIAGTRGHGGAISIIQSTARNLMELDFVRIPFTLSISECEFVNNSAGSEGGAVFMRNVGSNITIVRSRFLDNSATAQGNNPSGGAISVSGNEETTLIEQCMFSGNTAMYDGGAVAVSGTGRSLTVRESTFLNNRANLIGGGIAQSRVTVANLETQIDNCTFISNMAADNCGAIEARQVNMTSTTFKFNVAGNDGGAGCSRRANIFNSTFSNNTAELSSGGAMRLLSRSVIEDSIFTGNSAGEDGGAVSGANQINRCIFTNNRATQDGGALAWTTNIQDSIFENNTAGEDGGAVSTVQVFVRKSYFSGNEAENLGGAITIRCSFNVCPSVNTSMIQDSTFVRNSAMKDVGGALYFSATGVTVTLTNNIFDSNLAVLCGAVSLLTPVVTSGNPREILSVGNTLYIANSTFTRNRVSRNLFIVGGGALCLRNVTTTIVKTSFGNMEGSAGGVMSINGGETNIANSSFVNNIARATGGVIYVHFSWSPVIVAVTNSIFTGNRARNSGGVFSVFSNGSSIDITDSTLQRNFAHRGGVFDIDGVRLQLSDSIVSENTANLPGNTITACDSNITILNSSDVNYFYNITRNSNTPILRPDTTCFVYDLVRRPPPSVTTPTIVPSATPTKTLATSDTMSSSRAPPLIETTPIVVETPLSITSSSIKTTPVIDTEATSSTSVPVSTLGTRTISPTITPSAVQRPVSTTTVPVAMTTSIPTTTPPPITTDGVSSTTNSSNRPTQSLLVILLITTILISNLL